MKSKEYLYKKLLLTYSKFCCWKTGVIEVSDYTSLFTIQQYELFLFIKPLLYILIESEHHKQMMYQRKRKKIRFRFKIKKTVTDCQYKWTHRVKISVSQTNPVPSKAARSQYLKLDCVYTDPLIRTSLLSYYHPRRR